MKSMHLQCAIAALAAALAGSANASPGAVAAPNLADSPVYVRTDGLPTALALRLEREAGKGLRPLRQYVERTRYIHQIDLISLLMTREQARLAVIEDGKTRLVQIARS